MLLSVVLFAMVAQVFPGRQGEGTEIVGWVEEKSVSSITGETEYVIVIDGTRYTVPHSFWREARVGDLVKYDGYRWTIVKKAGSQPPRDAHVTRTKRQGKHTLPLAIVDD